jgi:diaminohydroxyphosphoribosylaminopyrimidine deaminase/5-amino-6-(5-phosphoribosylamino)uracil reductase
MLRALALAAAVAGTTSPNPAVGSVLVKDGLLVGEGATAPPGGPHAEVLALRQAGERARGATLYVTLEPCSHHGRTPPCAQALLEAGVREVHLALLDPSPWVDGGGRRALEAAGVRVVVGEHAEPARRVNEAFLKWASTGLPFVTAKYAMTLDGKIATHAGDSRWVSGAAARALVGQWRQRSDAILVGVQTLLRDNPQLTARDVDGQPLPRQPLRVILDSRARTPLAARAVAPDAPGRALVIVSAAAVGSDVERLRAGGIEVERVAERNGRLDPRAALALLGQRQVTSVLVEAGGTLLASLVEDGLVDKLVAFVAPKLLGGSAAPTPLGGVGAASMDQAVELDDVSYELVGRDVMISGYPRCSRAS